MMPLAEEHAAEVILRGVRKAYRRTVILPGLDLTLPRGETLALLGHNGAGKSTVIKLMLGLVRPSGGAIDYRDAEGRAVDGAYWRRGVGFLPESLAFPGNLSGRETLRFHARLKGCPPQEADALLEDLELGDAADARVRTWSKGMRQRLGLAQALLGSPATLILDEPTSGLDPALRRALYARIEAHRAAGGTVLLSSHALNEVEHVVTRCVLLHRGTVCAAGTPATLREQAALPIRVRVTAPASVLAALAARLGSALHWRTLGEDVAETACMQHRLPGLVQAIAACGDAVRDVEITPARLDAVYAELGRQDAAQ